MKKLIEESVISEKFLHEWDDKTIRLDKDSSMYDKRAEKKFRDLLQDCITWFKTVEMEVGGEDSDDKNEDKEEAAEEEEAADEDAPKQETAGQKKQKEMIEKERLAQAAALEKHRAKAQLEEKKKEEDVAIINNRENRINLEEDEAVGDVDDI